MGAKAVCHLADWGTEPGWMSLAGLTRGNFLPVRGLMEWRGFLREPGCSWSSSVEVKGGWGAKITIGRCFCPVPSCPGHLLSRCLSGSSLLRDVEWALGLGSILCTPSLAPLLWATSAARAACDGWCPWYTPLYQRKKARMCLIFSDFKDVLSRCEPWRSPPVQFPRFLGSGFFS